MDRDRLLKQFGKDGWVLVPSLLTASQIEQARNGVQWAMAQPAEEYKWIKPRTYEWHSSQPIFVELIEHPFVVDFARAFLGADFHLIAAQCSRNTRDDFYAPGADAMHQDAVFFPQPGREVPGRPLDTYSFSAMWYVQDTPAEMGPTHLASGSQNSVTAPDDSAVESAGGALGFVPAGSLLLFNHRTWHRGAPNRTALPRDLITNAYALRAIEKVQLLSPRPDETGEYKVCQTLMEKGSTMLKQLIA